MKFNGIDQITSIIKYTNLDGIDHKGAVSKN